MVTWIWVWSHGYGCSHMVIGCGHMVWVWSHGYGCGHMGMGVVTWVWCGHMVWVWSHGYGCGHMGMGVVTWVWAFLFVLWASISFVTSKCLSIYESDIICSGNDTEN